MSPIVFLVVLGAALLHALWNALVKGGADPRLNLGAVVLGHVPFALVLLPFAAAPALTSLPYLACGVALHVGYQLFLLRSYETGELTQVYPIARGSAPLFVTLVATLFLGVRLAPREQLAIAIIGLGILSLARIRRSDGKAHSKAALSALVTGAFIASYSLVDGYGARAAGTALGFYGWLAVGNGIVMALYLRLTAPGTVRRIFVEGRTLLLLGGGASFAAYALVTWAFTQAPIPLVTALRETSIVFALLIGVFALKERLGLLKIVATAATLFGAILLRFGQA